VAIDIIVFALIAGFLIYRLNSVLGSRHGDERQRRNPFADDPAAADRAAPANGPVIEGAAVPLAPSAPLVFDGVVDPARDADGRIREGLQDIAAADRFFDLPSFIGGARYAFEMVVTAYARGERETLRGLLSPKLYAGFEQGIAAREQAGHTTEITIHRIKRATIIEAHLGGTMAYVTVDFDVEQTTVTRDAEGRIVDGDPERIFSVEDIWTFTRDTRSSDPNWMLIETRAGGDAA
jgi:predicted lipid-binding transport protein (Tim44 family)